MRMTTKGRYALRAALALAKRSEGNKPVSIKTISGTEEISPEFLEQIFFKLRKAGLISSVRGPGGGFFFSRPLSEISLKDLVDASGEGVEISPCACGLPSACEHVKECTAGAIWRELASHIDVFLTSMSLEEIVRRDMQV